MSAVSSDAAKISVAQQSKFYAINECPLHSTMGSVRLQVYCLLQRKHSSFLDGTPSCISSDKPAATHNLDLLLGSGATG